MFDRMASARAIAVTQGSSPAEQTTQAEIQPADSARAELPLLLIVDDEPDMRRYLASMLRDNYRVIEAEDGISALEKAKEHKPVLMLLDVMLPGVTGLEVCRTLKERPETRGIKIIVLTARADEEAKIIALK